MNAVCGPQDGRSAQASRRFGGGSRSHRFGGRSPSTGKHNDNLIYCIAPLSKPPGSALGLYSPRPPTRKGLSSRSSQESANQQFTVLEEVDPDEPFNIEVQGVLRTDTCIVLWGEQSLTHCFAGGDHGHQASQWAIPWRQRGAAQ